MPLPDHPRRNLSLERLGDRDGSRNAHVGESAQVAGSEASAGRASEILKAYQALIDAVFTAPGAAEWLVGLRQKVAALLHEKNRSAAQVVSSDAIRQKRQGDPDSDYRRSAR